MLIPKPSKQSETITYPPMNWICACKEKNWQHYEHCGKCGTPRPVPKVPA